MPGNPLYREWTARVKERGSRLEMKILEETEDSAYAGIAEKYWIQRLRVAGQPLLNIYPVKGLKL